MTLRVASLVFATDSGLGILAKSFYDHGIINDVMMIAHGRHPEHPEWYPGKGKVNNLKSRHDVDRLKEFCKQQDVMLFFETPFAWELIPYCREVGVKTALMVMHECSLDRWPYQPDLIINPSALDQQCYPDGVFIPVPVDTKLIPWRRRERAEVFRHNAGHGGLKGRNGTKELLKAMQFIKSPAKMIFHTQDGIDGFNEDISLAKERKGWVCYRHGTNPYETMMLEGDVFLFPEKFNGLSLPLQEARAAGMLVMATDRFPMNTWLPKEPLIPVASYVKNRIGPPYREFDQAVIDPKAIAAKIDEWYGADISAYSEQGREWAEANSWEKLGPKYKELLEELREQP